MESEYAQRYRRLYDEHWWWRSRELVILRLLEKTLAPQLDPSHRHDHGDLAILDVGSGDGLFFNELSQFGSVEGIEADPALVADDSQHRNKIHVGTLETFNATRRYDLVLMLDVLEHIEDAVSALKIVRSLLTDNGALLLTVPAFRAIWTHHDDLNHHFTRYTKRSLAKVTDAAGLRTVHRKYFFHWLFGAKLAVRAVESMRRKPSGLPDVPGPLVNKMLKRICRLEHSLLHPLNLPFGSSLIALLRIDGQRPPMDWAR